MEGLLSHFKRKKSWQVAEGAGKASPYEMQYLLDRARWDAAAVQERLSEYVKKELGSVDAVLILDETGFLKRACIQPECSGSTAEQQDGSKTATSGVSLL